MYLQESLSSWQVHLGEALPLGHGVPQQHDRPTVRQEAGALADVPLALHLEGTHRQAEAQRR